jgi:hypothetical protein
MGNNDLLEKVLTGAMDENIRTDLLRHFFKISGRKTTRIPRLKDCQNKLNCDEIYARMKAAAGGTGVSVARLLGISPQGFNNQITRRAISGNSIIDFHLKTGVSVDWLVGSWDGSSADYIDAADSSEEDAAKVVDHPSQKYLSLVEVYDQSSGNVELKWCLTKHHVCLDDANLLIPDDFGALLSLIIRYREESGTPDRVKNSGKRHFQVRRVLAYVLGTPKAIRQIDARAKYLTSTHISGHIDRPGKTEFRLYSAKEECLAVFKMLAEQNGQTMVKPKFDTIAWDFLIGKGSFSPRDWVLNKLKSSRSIDVPGWAMNEKPKAGSDYPHGITIHPDSFVASIPMFAAV